MNFTSGAEMLDYLIGGKDLYSQDLGMYVFCYNELGAIAFYLIDIDQAVNLEKEARLSGEYWGAFLGPGGYICDDPSDDFNPPSPGNSNIDFCNRYYLCDWINCEDVLAETCE